MRSLSVKITLVLVVVSIIGALFTSFYIQNRTQKAFETFILNQDEEILVEALTDHYQINGSWENARIVFMKVFPFLAQNNQAESNPGENPGGKSSGANAPFILTSPDGEIQDTTPGPGSPKAGNPVPLADIENKIPLEIEGELVGWLVPAGAQRPHNNTQNDFLNTVQQGLIISSIVTLLIALTLGGFLIQSFTRPIRKLAGATEMVASGELGYQVDIHTKDELGKLAASFNSMSTDLEKSDLARKQMTADIAHDLRTPLTVLQGYTEAMSEGKMNGSPEIFQTMHQQSQHLSYLIDDLKTLSLLDSEELNFQIQNIYPARVLQELEPAFTPLALEKGVQINSEIPKNLPLIELDSDRLNQIMGNLINNALQVLPPGGAIKISAQQSGNDLVIEVSDNGPGISAANLPLIFNRSFRADESRASNGSSGLGLAITKKLVEAQGGEISVTSTLGQGTTFRVIFPSS